MKLDHRRLLEIAQAAARDAGVAIMQVYSEPFVVSHKPDHSPVTRADELAESIVLERLAAATPDIPVIAEESSALRGLPGAAPPRFWLVDPLDGTKEFVARNGEFTVNIALIEDHRSVLGVIHIPVRDLTYAAAGRGTATRQYGRTAARPIAARPVPAQGPIVVHSRSHSNEAEIASFLASLPQPERRLAGSSVKFCLLAAGEADIYPRFGRTMEWDTAAGQAILEAAGGSVTTGDGEPLRYGKPGFVNPDFIARGRAPEGGG